MALSSRRVLQRCRPFIQTTKRNFCTSENEKHNTFPARVFSGIQPTGIPHIGNYFGAIRNWVKFQEKYSDVIYSIVDLHSITVSQDPGILRDNIMAMTACLLACGIDPDRSILFQQSQVPQHTELAWILGCMCTIPRLAHLPQWKEKSAQSKEQRVGLFTYPVLQTADILLYKATDVPVGVDQWAHIELAQDLAHSFNNRFEEIFPKPRILLAEVPKIKSLRHPESKMSKSEVDEKSRIELTDSPDEILMKVKKSVTDAIPGLSYDMDKRPGVSNLIRIESAITGKSPKETCIVNQNFTLGKYKLRIADLLIEELSPIRKNIELYMKDKHYLQSVLEKGRQKATDIAQPNITQVKSLVGFF